MSARSWRRRSAAFALPVVLASGCLLVAPPEDLPALGAGGSGAQGGGGSAGSSVVETGGSGASVTAGGDAGGETNPEGGGPGSGGNAGAAGSGEAGAGGSSAVGGSAGGGGTGGTGGSGQPMGGAGEGGAPECTTNQECVDLTHVEARCRNDHTCVTLKSPECLTVYGPFGDPNALYIGSFAVLDPENPGASDIALAEKLAVNEINAAGGLPGGPDGGRPLVLIVCTNDETAETGAISLGMTHLAEEVEVPALIAMLQPDDLTKAFEQEPDKKLFFLNPVATIRALTNHTYNRGLLWTLLGQPSDYAPAYGLLLGDLEKQVHSERGLSTTDKIKVAVVDTTDSFSADLYLYMFQSLEFNGTKAGNQEPDYFQEFSLDPAAAVPEKTITDLAAFEPDVVISAAGDVMTALGGVLPRLEAGWTSTKPRPYYLLSPYNATSDAKGTIQGVVTDEVNAMTNPEPDAARRFLGVNAAPALDLTLENAFEKRYYDAFTDQKPPAAANTDNYYDAVYYLAYAMYAGDSMTGPGIARGMKRLVSGDSLDDGPADDAISKVFTALDANNASDSLSLNTTLGPSDVFDPMTGVRPVTPGVYCFTLNGGLTLRANELRYDPTDNAFTGTYHCLDNFPPP